MVGNYFNIREFHKPMFHVPLAVEYKIKEHIKVLNPIRETLGCAITVSKKSGYRPREYEITRGRSGKSEHCFYGKGAVDLTCREDHLQELYELLKESEYTRVCLYVNEKFIHCDFKPVPEGKLAFIDLGHGWERVEKI